MPENPSGEGTKPRSFSVSGTDGQHSQNGDFAGKTCGKARDRAWTALLGSGEFNDFRDQCRHFLESLVGFREFFRQLKKKNLALYRGNGFGFRQTTSSGLRIVETAMNFGRRKPSYEAQQSSGVCGADE